MDRKARVKMVIEQLLSEDCHVCSDVAPKPNKRSDAMKKSYQRRRDVKNVKSRFKNSSGTKVKLA